MKKILITTLVAGLVLPFAASAEWELISDFETEESLEAWVIDNRLSRNEPDDAWDSSWGIVPRPFDDLGGFALSAAEGTVRWQILDVGIDLGPLPTTNVYTLFYEVAQTDLTGSRIMGLHPDTPDFWFTFDESDGTWSDNYAWAAYSTVHRMGDAGLNVWAAPGNAGYADNYSDEQQPQVWYRFWMVVNPVDFAWDLYTQGGEFEEVTRVTTAVDTGYFWRNATFDPLRTFRLRLQGETADRTPTGAPTYFDNLFLDRTGENLTLPPRPGGEVILRGPGVFFDYIVADGWVDTGDWMGWVTVDTYPFFYINVLDSWGYSDGNASPFGAWVFMIDLNGTSGNGGGDGPGIFSAFSVDDGWVDTGDWMGMVYVESYPHVYMLSSNAWVLGSEAALSSGAWVYAFK